VPWPQQALAAKDAHVDELRRQLAGAQRASSGAAAGHDEQLGKLIASLTQMKEACTAQVRARAHCGSVVRALHAPAAWAAAPVQC
jgi:hypothetical protein